MSNVNPWIGWSSYDDDMISKGKAFVGRSTETSELFSLIDNNLLVTLYGKSGIGKTSLLNAGVFPSLKAADYEPIICRCGESDYIDNIVTQIGKHCSLSSKYNIYDFANLVDLFKYVEFSRNGNSVFPVLVFDQFEDWFRPNSTQAEKLLSDITFLTSNDYEGITNYRFVISIREDYLYLLEDAIDRQQLQNLKSNRYRLTELERSQTEEILDLGDIDNVVRERLLEISKGNNGYNPGLISFFCSELYELYPNGITSSALQMIVNENALVERYYNRCFEIGKISESTKNYIEKKLQDDGLRRPQNLKSVKQHISDEDLNKLLKGSNKLLRKFPVGDEEHIELIHDRIAEIINSHRNKQISLQRDKSIAMSVVLYFVAIGFYIWDVLLKIMHASWGIMDNNSICYIKKLLNQAYDKFIPIDIDIDSVALIKYLIGSQCIGYVTMIYLLVVEIPKLICRYYYNNLSINKTILVVLAIIVSYFLSSSTFIGISIHSSTFVYAIFGWIIVYLGLILSGISKK